jgi:hypothetical protein
MSKKTSQINCLKRLDELTNQINDILVFLKEEEVISEAQFYYVQKQADKAKELQYVLADASLRKEVQMVTYEWTILPVENICINIVTDRAQREFVFNG